MTVQCIFIDHYQLMKDKPLFIYNCCLEMKKDSNSKEKSGRKMKFWESVGNQGKSDKIRKTSLWSAEILISQTKCKTKISWISQILYFYETLTHAFEFWYLSLGDCISIINIQSCTYELSWVNYKICVEIFNRN